MLRITFTLGVLLFYCTLISKGKNVYTDSLLTELGKSQEDTNRVFLLNELSWEYALADPELSIGFAERAISLASDLNYKEGLSVGHNYLGRAYSMLGKYQLSIDEIKKSLALDKESGNLFGMASAHNQLGTGYKSLGDYEKAIFHLYESFKILESLGADFSVGQVKLNIAYFAFDQEDFAKAIQLANEALIIFEEFEDQQMIGAATGLMAMGYQSHRKYDKALALYKVAMTIFIQEEDGFSEAGILNNMGTLFHEKQELEKALHYYEKSLSLEDSLGNSLNIATSHANIAMVYADMGKKEKSIEHMNASIRIGKEIGRLKDVMGRFEYASRVHYLNENYKNAYEYRLAYDQLKDTIFSVKRSEQILAVQEEFESERKEKKIEILKNERDAAEAKSLLVDSVIFFSIGVFLLLVIIVIIYVKHRKNLEDRQKLELEQKVLRSQMNPHFIFNSLNSIQRLFLEGDEDLANDYISDFGKLLRIILENSGSSRISIRKEIETVKLYLEIEMVRLNGLIEYHFEIDPDLDQLNNFIPPLILQPFVENAIWHGILPKENEEKGIITINLAKASDSILVCTVIDNGIGVQESLKRKQNDGHASKGLNITQQRLGMSNQIKVEELESGGTKVTLTIPLDL